MLHAATSGDMAGDVHSKSPRLFGHFPTYLLYCTKKTLHTGSPIFFGPKKSPIPLKCSNALQVSFAHISKMSQFTFGHFVFIFHEAMCLSLSR